MSGTETLTESLPRESEDVQVMQVLDLLIDVAYHDGTDRDLAVASEAWWLAGYSLSAIDVSHAGGHNAVLERVSAARHRREKRPLRHDAMGVLYAVRSLVREGVVEGREASLRTNERWKERGGYDR